MESLRKQDRSTSLKNNKASVGIISHLVSIKDVKENGGVGRKITEELLKCINIQINSSTRIRDIIEKIYESEYGIVIEEVGSIKYPKEMNPNISDITGKDKSFKTKLFSNILSDGDLTQMEFINLMEIMDEACSITDLEISLSTSPNNKGYHVTLIESSKIKEGPFFNRKNLIKLWIPY